MLRIQRNYVEAGSDVIITNTFGASRIMLDRHGQGDRTVAINREGAAIAREAGAQAVIASIAFDRMADEDDVRTMAGISPGQAAEFMAANGCDIAALNCGTGVDVTMAAKIVQRYRGSCDLPQLLAAGPRIVGGCCGSTPAHIRLFRQLIDKYNHPSRV